MPFSTHLHQRSAAFQQMMIRGQRVVVVLGFFALFPISGCGLGTPELPYSALLTEIEADNVINAVLYPDGALVTFKKPPKGDSSGTLEFAVTLSEAERPELTVLLRKHGVEWMYGAP